MAKEFKHGSVGTSLTQAEWEADGTHVIAGQAAGDLPYASTTTQLTGLAIGAANRVLTSSGTAPQWSASLALSGTLTLGVDDTGYDAKFFGDTAGRYWLWDASADGVVQIGTLTIGVDDAGHDVKYFGDTASRYWLWDTSADGVVQRGTLTVGVDDTGHDVKFFGATASTYMLWDESTDDLVLTLGAELYFYDAAGGEHIKSDGTDMTIYAGTDLNLTAGTDINIPADVGLTFGNDGEKIEGDGTNLTIAGNIINLSGAVTASGLVSTDGKVVIGGTVDGTHHDQLRIKSPNTTLAVNQDYYALNVNPGGEITTPSSGENTNVGIANFVATAIDKTAGSSIVNAFTVKIGNAPTAGDNNMAFWVASGMALFADGTNIGGTSSNNRIDDASGGSGSTTLYIGNASITTSSDARLKTNIRPTGIDALALLGQMDVVDFGWDDPSDVAEYGRNYRGTYTGMVAQDTVKLAPWIINDMGGGRDCDDCMAGRECDQHGMFHVEYQHLVPTLIKAIQELHQDLEEVRNGN